MGFGESQSGQGRLNVAALVEEIEARVERMPVRNTPTVRVLRREYSKRIQAVTAEDVVKVAAALIANRRVPRLLVMSSLQAIRTL